MRQPRPSVVILNCNLILACLRDASISQRPPLSPKADTLTQPISAPIYPKCWQEKKGNRDRAWLSQHSTLSQSETKYQTFWRVVTRFSVHVGLVWLIELGCALLGRKAAYWVTHSFVTRVSTKATGADIAQSFFDEPAAFGDCFESIATFGVLGATRQKFLCLTKNATWSSPTGATAVLCSVHGKAAFVLTGWRRQRLGAHQMEMLGQGYRNGECSDCYHVAGHWSFGRQAESHSSCGTWAVG